MKQINDNNFLLEGESPTLKMMKNAFCFILKALLVNLILL